MHKLLPYATLFLLLTTTSILNCQVREPGKNIWLEKKMEAPIPYEKLLPGKYYGPELKKRNPDNVSAIIVHSTKGLPAWKYLTESWKNQWNIHLIIDTMGNVYGEKYPATFVYPTAPGMDSVTIHIALVGTSYQSRTNKKQWATLLATTQALAQEYNIPLNNHDISSKKGIFSHNQSKKRYGGFISLKEYGEEQIVSKLLKDLKGKYYPELKWKDRFDSKWTFRKEDSKKIKAKFKPDRGRGITKTPRAGLKSLEQTQSGKVPEKYRVRYEHRGKIQPSCVVLHYTAINSFFKSLKVLENRSLTASIMVDKNGKAYQLLDSLEEQPSTAYGTNENCVQIEIVGRGTRDLMRNKAQSKKVVELVQELSKKYDFPLNNLKIESYRGVFSHTQAKKKFGGSSFLIGKDFDPGEEYMKKIITQAGGKYYSESEWFERGSENWVILNRDFQP